MGRKRKSALSEEKRDIIGQLLEVYDIKTAADVQEALKDLLGGTLQSMLEAELDHQIAEREEADPGYNDSRNGYKTKRLRSSVGEIPIQVPQDRKSDFEPQVVPKYHKDISEIEGKIIAMYARGMSVAQVSAQIKDIYGFGVSESMVSDITDKILPEIEMWQKRPLSAVYPIVYVDGIVFNVRENNVIRKATAYVVLGLNEEGRKEVLSITIGESESAKFWLSVLNELYLQRSFQPKQGRAGHLHPLLGRIEWTEGGHCGGLSAGRASEVYCPHGTQHAEVRGKQGHEVLCQ